MSEPARQEGPERLLVDLLERWATPALFFRADGTLAHANRAASELFGAVELEREPSFARLFEPAGDEHDVLPRTSVLARRPFQRLALDPLEHGLAGWVAFCATDDGDREQHVMEALAGLAGGVAHDFNNHLTAILSHAQLALSELELGGARAHLDEIESAALRARLLTQQLLAFSRRRIPHTSEVDVNDVVRRSREALRAVLGPAVAITLELAPDLGPLRLDPSRLERILIELARLMNVELLARGGRRCTIATSRSAAPGWIELRLSAPGTRFAARPGIASHELPAITALVEQGGGRLSVEGDGESAVVHLECIPHERSLEPCGERDEGQKVIWVAEDDDAVRAVVRLVLERAGFRVRAVENGLQALELARSAPALDLLISDVRMPGMNGVELYRRLAALRPGLRVLFMSGLVEDDSVRDMLANPEFAFLQKPFTTKELLLRVRSVLSAAAPTSGARILIVDDEPEVLKLIPRLLAGEGYHCTAVPDVAQALQALGNAPFELVLCDVVMPERDGLDLLREVAARFPATQVVAMTGHKLGGPGLAAARELGAVQALKKPFSRDELLFALSQARSVRAA